MAKVQCFVGLILLVMCHSSDAVTRIQSISFEGNDVTQESIMHKEMFVREGDVLDEEKIAMSVQAIMDLDLFRSVSYYLSEEYDEPSLNGSQVHLVFILEEKYYLLVIPRIRIDDDEAHLGIQLRWDNVYGLNQQLRLLVEDRGVTAGVSEKRQRFRYRYPNVNGSAYSLSFAATKVNDVDDNETEGLINRKDQSFSVSVFKWLNDEGRSRGEFAAMGLSYHDRDNDVISGSLPEEQLDAMVVEMQLGYSDVHRYAYNRGGKQYGYSLGISHHALGSSSEYFIHNLYYRGYYRFEKHPGENLNVQTRMGHATNDVLGDAAFSLGSNDDLRGYDNDRFEGNTLVLVNLEYLTTSSTPSFRYAYFLDIGNTYDDISDISLGKLKAGIGFGFRWKLPAFVKLDLRVDVGYGVSDEDYHVTVSTRHAF